MGGGGGPALAGAPLGGWCCQDMGPPFAQAAGGRPWGLGWASQAPSGPSALTGSTLSAEGFPSSSAGSRPPRTSGIMGWRMRTCPSEYWAPSGWRLLPSALRLPMPGPPRCGGAQRGCPPPQQTPSHRAPLPGCYGLLLVRRLHLRTSSGYTQPHAAPRAPAPPVVPPTPAPSRPTRPRLLLLGCPQKAKPAGHTGSAPSGLQHWGH